MALMKDLREQLQAHLDKFAIKDGQNAESFIDTSSPEAENASKQLISSALIHAVDISTSIRNFDVSETWADLLFDEFFAQGDYEREHGMEVSFLCDRHTTEIAGGQVGFIDFVVLPLFKQLGNINQDVLDVQVQSGKTNMNLFKLKAEAEQASAEVISDKEEEVKSSNCCCQ